MFYRPDLLFYHRRMKNDTNGKTLQTLLMLSRDDEAQSVEENNYDFIALLFLRAYFKDVALNPTIIGDNPLVSR